MGGETANTAEVANKVSKDLFKWFGWEAMLTMDQNFICHKPEKHRKKKTDHDPEKHQHPVDVVFKYFDPYIDRYVYLNTDLKSYAKSSIQPSKLHSAFVSLSKTLECAKGSPVWQKRYMLDDKPHEVRAMLFIYNHDNEYDNDFLSKLSPTKLTKLPLPENGLLHLLEPSRIIYLHTVTSDMKALIAEDTFPRNRKYSFVYPDLLLHKRHGDILKHPATIETLCSPYMMIRHEAVVAIDEANESKTKEVAPAGYLVYYNQSGATVEEFMYFFDYLSGFQILSGQDPIRVRVAHRHPDEDIKSNYKKAISRYVDDWGLDKYKRQDLERIDFDVITSTTPNYSPGILAWRITND